MMEPDTILLHLLMAAAVSGAVWVCLPDILFLTGLSRVRHGVLGGPEEVRCGAGELVTEEIAEQLGALGFTPAGLHWEQLPAHKCFRVAVFVSRADECFASVYRLLNNDPSRVAFKTPFANGAFALTQNYIGGMEADEETLRAGGPPCTEKQTLETRTPLAEVLEEHRRRVWQLVLAGHACLPAESLDDYAEAEEIYMDHPTVRRQFRESVAVLLGVKLAFLAGVPGIVAALRGVDPPALWAALLMASLIVLLVRYYGFPLFAWLDRILPAEGRQ
jgi:hypothetical protein